MGPLKISVATRWLLLESYVEKDLKNYSTLESMFLSRNLDSSRFNDGRQEENHIDKTFKGRDKRLKKSFFDHLTKVHVSFYANELLL